jgi:hypothetical protein
MFLLKNCVLLLKVHENKCDVLNSRPGVKRTVGKFHKTKDTVKIAWNRFYDFCENRLIYYSNF